MITTRKQQGIYRQAEEWTNPDPEQLIIQAERYQAIRVLLGREAGDKAHALTVLDIDAQTWEQRLPNIRRSLSQLKRSRPISG